MGKFVAARFLMGGKVSVQQAKVRADCVNINEELTYQRNTSKKNQNKLALFMGCVTA